jgi:hypothetical protein
MARVEIPAPGDLIMDEAGNVRVGVTVSLTLAGTVTAATHYSALTAGTFTTGGLVTGSDGTIVDGSAVRRYVDEGSYDLTILGRTRRIEAVSGRLASSVRVRSLRDFYTGTAQPADVLSYIHDGLNWSAQDGGVLLIPDDIEEPWSISGPIVPPPNSRMMAPNPAVGWSERLGASHGSTAFQLPANPDTIGEAWIRLANSANSPILTNDYGNTAGKRGPDPRGNGRYFQWFTALGITFDHNGANQTGTLRAIDIRNAWSMNFPWCRVVDPRGRAYSFEACNACDAPFAAAAGFAENVANGTGDTTNASPTVANASGTWAIGDLIAGTNIPADTYISNVVGATLTLAKTSDGTVQNATGTGTGVSLSKPTYRADYLLALTNGTTDCRFPEVNVHGVKTAGVLLDSVWGNRVSGDSGFAIGGYNLQMADSFTLGCFENKIDLRLEQATKHNARLDSGCYDNTLLSHAYTPGLYSSAADADGGWANAFIDGKFNWIGGTGSKRAGQPSTLSAVVRYGANAQLNNGTMTGGSELVAGTPLYAFNGVASSSLTRSNRTPEPARVMVPWTQFQAANGTTPVSATFNTVHKVLSFADATSDEAVAYVSLPDGARNFKFTVFMVNLNSGVSGNVRVQLGFADVVTGFGQTLGADEQTLGPSTVAIAASTATTTTTFSGASVTVPTDTMVALRFKRIGADGADTLAAALGLVGVRIDPQLTP